MWRGQVRDWAFVFLSRYCSCVCVWIFWLILLHTDTSLTTYLQIFFIVCLFFFSFLSFISVDPQSSVFPSPHETNKNHHNHLPFPFSCFLFHFSFIKKKASPFSLSLLVSFIVKIFFLPLLFTMLFSSFSLFLSIFIYLSLVFNFSLFCTYFFKPSSPFTHTQLLSNFLSLYIIWNVEGREIKSFFFFHLPFYLSHTSFSLSLSLFSLSTI